MISDDGKKDINPDGRYRTMSRKTGEKQLKKQSPGVVRERNAFVIPTVACSSYPDTRVSACERVLAFCTRSLAAISPREGKQNAKQ